MVTRPVLTEPFEPVALDRVGPFPKSSGGFNLVLTLICMSTRWLQAISLKIISVKVVVQRLIAVLLCHAIPNSL